MKTFITVKNQFEGVHKYKDAPEQVKFLRNDHRHIFVITSKIEVFHEDRELEFIIVKHLINDFLNSQIENNVWYMDNLSCEQVATKIYTLLKNNYGFERKISVEVSEDNENSAIIEEEN